MRLQSYIGMGRQNSGASFDNVVGVRYTHNNELYLQDIQWLDRFLKFTTLPYDFNMSLETLDSRWIIQDALRHFVMLLKTRGFEEIGDLIFSNRFMYTKVQVIELEDNKLELKLKV